MPNLWPFGCVPISAGAYSMKLYTSVNYGFVIKPQILNVDFSQSDFLSKKLFWLLFG